MKARAFLKWSLHFEKAPLACRRKLRTIADARGFEGTCSVANRGPRPIQCHACTPIRTILRTVPAYT